MGGGGGGVGGAGVASVLSRVVRAAKTFYFNSKIFLIAQKNRNPIYIKER